MIWSWRNLNYAKYKRNTSLWLTQMNVAGKELCPVTTKHRPRHDGHPRERRGLLVWRKYRYLTHLLAIEKRVLVPLRVFSFKCSQILCSVMYVLSKLQINSSYLSRNNFVFYYIKWFNYFYLFLFVYRCYRLWHLLRKPQVNSS